jgi:hypothetical protein
MAISRFKTSTVAQGLPKYQDVWDQTTVIYQPVTSGLTMNLDAGNTSSYPGSGTTWTDLSGNGRNISLSNTSYGGSGTGGYLIFNGTNAFGSLGSNLISGNVAHTVTVWTYQLSTPSAAQEYWSQWSESSTSTSWFFGPSSGTNMRYSDNWGGAGTTIENNQWICWTATFDGTTANIYKNGVSIGTRTGFSQSGTQAFFIGKQGTGAFEYAHARMSLVRSFNRALTQAEVTQDFGAYRERYGI